MSHSIRHDRRAFLRNVQAVLAGGAAINMFPQLELVGRALAASGTGDGYRALVCIFLFGGNDSFNMLIPYDNAEYNIYDTSRGGVYDEISNSSGLGIARDQLVQVTDTQGKQWGLHPSCADMSPLFAAGELAFVANVGTLVQPLSKTDIINKTAPLPLYLYSHLDQYLQWMRGYSGSASAGTGWGGLTADRVRALNTGFQALPPSLSVSGNNLFQFGESTLPFVLASGGPAPLDRFRAKPGDQIRKDTLEGMIQAQYTHVMQDEYGVIGDNAILLNDVLGDALDPLNGGDVATVFPDTTLGLQLHTIARMIKAGQTPALGQSRQIYYVGLGGFDTHKDQMLAESHSALLMQLSQGLSAFRAALAEIGSLNDVATFTMSDFGRTLNSNGDGSDHAWGSVQLVMSGATANGGTLQGKQIWGDYPLLELDGERSLGRGEMIPTTSVNQMGAALSYWLGASDSDLSAIFPGIENFSPQRLGFLG